MKYLLVITIAIVAWYISTLIPEFSNYIIDIIIRSTALTLLFMVPVYYFKISEDLNGRIEDALAKIGVSFEPNKK